MTHCPDCTKGEYYWQVCRVCELVDDDAQKKKCKYCPLCNAFICDGCYYSERRLGAVALDQLGKAKKLGKAVFETLLSTLIKK